MQVNEKEENKGFDMMKLIKYKKQICKRLKFLNISKCAQRLCELEIQNEEKRKNIEEELKQYCGNGPKKQKKPKLFLT